MGNHARTGVLLLQLGTPSAPTTRALRAYLREFLSDRRVIDLPRAIWLPILHGIVLRTRPRRSARLYASIWTPMGSPLAVISERQAAGLQQRLDPAAARITVRIAMRYGAPSIPSVVAEMLRAGVTRLLAVPMYPQYAGATTGSSLERLLGVIGARSEVPALRVVPPFPDDPGYIGALAGLAEGHLRGRTIDHVVLSFHGLPERYARAGDPYPGHCERTAAELVRRMAWAADQVTLAFQSRFGPEPWLQPYTDATLRRLAESGRRRVAVMCPGFTTDCLETLEEMAVTNCRVFVDAGGTDYHYVPCLNDSTAWLEALERLVRRELAGWV